MIHKAWWTVSSDRTCVPSGRVGWFWQITDEHLPELSITWPRWLAPNILHGPGLRKFQAKNGPARPEKIPDQNGPARPEKISDLNGPAWENFRPKRPGLRIIPQDLQHCCTGVFCFNIYPSIIFLIWLIEAFLTGHIRFLWNPCLDILTLIVKNSSKITNRIFEFFGKTPVPTVFTVPRHIICHKCLCFFS